MAIGSMSSTSGLTWLSEDDERGNRLDDINVGYETRALGRATAELYRLTQPTTPQPPQGWQSGLLGLALRPFSGIARGGLNSVAGVLHGAQFLSHVFGAEPVGDSAESMARWFMSASAAIEPDDPGFLDRLAEGFGSMATYALMGGGLGLAARGVGLAGRAVGLAGAAGRAAGAAQAPGAAGAMAPWVARVTGLAPFNVVEALSEAGSTFAQLKDEGMDLNAAAAKAGQAFGANLVLLGATNRLGIFGHHKTFAAKAGWSALWEGLQEGGQYGIQQHFQDKEFNLRDFIESAAIGAIVGGVGGTFEGKQLRLPSELNLDSPTLRALYSDIRNTFMDETGAVTPGAFFPEGEGLVPAEGVAEGTAKALTPDERSQAAWAARETKGRENRALDAEAVEKYRGGDATALNARLEFYQPQLEKYARITLREGFLPESRLLPSQEETEEETRSGALLRTTNAVSSMDLVQDTYIKALEKIDSFDATKASLGTWLHGILGGELSTELRAQRTRSRLAPMVSADTPVEDPETGEIGPRYEFDLSFATTELNPEQFTEEMQEQEARDRALESLSKADREILEMRDKDSLSYLPFADIAQKRGTTVGAAKMQHKRAETRLGKILKVLKEETGAIKPDAFFPGGEGLVPAEGAATEALAGGLTADDLETPQAPALFPTAPGNPIFQLSAAEARTKLAGGDMTRPNEVIAATAAIFRDAQEQGLGRISGYDTDRIRAEFPEYAGKLSDRQIGALILTTKTHLEGLERLASERYADIPGLVKLQAPRELKRSLANFIAMTDPGLLSELGKAQAEGRLMTSPEDRALIARVKRIQGRALTALESVDEDTLARAVLSLTKNADGVHNFERALVTGRQLARNLDLPELGSGAILKGTTGARHLSVFTDAWVSGLLANPTTHLVNFGANQIWFAHQVAQRFLSGVAGSVRRAFGGQEGGIYVGETYALLSAVFGHLPMAYRAATEAWSPGDTPGSKTEFVQSPFRESPADVILPVHLRETLFGRAFDYIFTWPGRALQVSDAFNKSLLEEGELQALRYREAWNSTAHITDPDQRFHKIKIVFALESTNPKLRQYAKNFALVGTFQNELGIATELGADKAGKAAQTIGTSMFSQLGQVISEQRNQHPALRFVVPFLRTATNITARSTEALLGPLGHDLRTRLRSGDPVKIDSAIGQIATTALTWATVGTMVHMGLVTGPGPDDPELKKQWEDAGFQPYSFWAGDRWVSYARMEPLGTVVGAVATLFDHSGYMTENEIENMSLSLIGNTAKLFASRTWMQNVWEFLGIVADPNPAKVERFLASEAASLVGGAIPSSGAWRFLFSDGDRRALDGFTQQLLSRMPRRAWADLPYDLDLFGNKRHQGAGFGPETDDSPIASWAWNRVNAVASPWLTTSASKEQQDLFQIFQDNGIRVSAMGRTLENVELNGFERNAIQRLAAGQDVVLAGRRLAGVRLGGQTMEEALRELVGSDWWQAAQPGRGLPTHDANGAPLASREALVNNIVRRYRNAAETEYKYGNPVHTEKIRQRAVKALERSASLDIR